jgi:hypothetical protein
MSNQTAGVKTPTNQKNETVQFGQSDTANAVVLDGSSAAATSAVLSTTEDVCVIVSSKAFADVWFSIGTSPTAVSETAGNGHFAGERAMIIPANNKISVIGAICCLEILVSE